MYNNNEYNKAYQQIIEEDFLNDVGNGVIKGITGIGKGISNVWKWNKKRIAKKEINTNIQTAINNSKNTINNAKTKIINIFSKINYSSILNITTIEQLKQYENLINKIRQQQNLIINSIQNINSIFPDFPIKTYLNDIKNIGTEINNKIINLNINITDNFEQFCAQQIQNIRQFFNEKAKTAYIKFKNAQLTKSLQNENIYNQIYLDIINEETSLKYNEPATNNSAITINAQNVQNTTKISKQLEQAKQDLYIKIYKYHILTFFIENASDQINRIINGTENADLQKLIKKMIKDTINTTNYKFDINTISELLNLYFIAGLCTNLTK